MADSHSIEFGNIFVWKDVSMKHDEICVDVIICYDKDHWEHNLIMRYTRAFDNANLMYEFRPFSLYYDNKWWVKIA